MIRKAGDVTVVLSNQISSKIKKKVFKKEPDNLRCLCGDPVQYDENGNEYFVIPASFGDYVKKTFPNYTVGDEFLPEADIATIAKPEVKSVAEEKKEAEKKKRGNPNWGKKKEIVEEEDDEDATDENG